MTRTTIIDAAREVARRRDAELVERMTSVLAPYSARVFFTPDDPDNLRVVIGDSYRIDVPLDRDLLSRVDLDDLALSLAQRLRLRWIGRPDVNVPVNITLGQE